jgi:cytochrome c oxidase cbb3-type subunit III
MADKKEIDAVTGVETTGHTWDGDLKELNKPLPKWWLYVLYATIIWSVGYWIAYPAWPTLSGYTAGYLGYSQRKALADDVAAAKVAQSKYVQAIAATPLTDISKNQELMPFVTAGGEAAFSNYCAPCHGRGAQGAIGYPNLNDDDWVWGGTLDDIQNTIAFGVRSGHKQQRDSAMPKFGIDGLLTPAQISDTAEYVLSFSGKAGNGAAAERGKAIFTEQCTTCHGEDGKGNKEFGAPNLTDGIWLYGSEKTDVTQSIHTGRGGVMPNWEGRIPPETIKMLAVYVYSLGGGK